MNEGRKIPFQLFRLLLHNQVFQNKFVYFPYISVFPEIQFFELFIMFGNTRFNWLAFAFVAIL